MSAPDGRIFNRAFLVGFLEKSTGKFLGAEIFSEESPTMSFKFFPFTILKTSGKNFEEAKDTLLAELDGEGSFVAWVKPFMRVRGTMTEQR